MIHHILQENELHENPKMIIRVSMTVLSVVTDCT